MNLWHAPRLLLRAHDCILQTGYNGHKHEVGNSCKSILGKNACFCPFSLEEETPPRFALSLYLRLAFTLLNHFEHHHRFSHSDSPSLFRKHSSLSLYSIYSNAQHGMEWGNLDALPGSTALWGAWLCLWGPGHLVIFRVGFFGVGIWPYIPSLEQRRSRKPRPLQTRMQESPLRKCYCFPYGRSTWHSVRQKSADVERKLLRPFSKSGSVSQSTHFMPFIHV